jgi:hypothetical protein
MREAARFLPSQPDALRGWLRRPPTRRVRDRPPFGRRQAIPNGVARAAQLGPDARRLAALNARQNGVGRLCV